MPPSRTPVFPNEILGIVSEHADHKALFTLCKTSSVLRALAQPLLFEQVELGPSTRFILGWCHAIERNPRLATRTRSLTMSLPFHLRDEDRTSVLRALRTCVQLKELSVYALAGETWSGDASVLVGFPFRLRAFRNSYFRWDDGMAQFLVEQERIQLLNVPFKLSDFADEEIQDFFRRPAWSLSGPGQSRLPNLTAVSMHTPLPRRPFRGIEAFFSGGYVGFLESYASTLTTLSLKTKQMYVSQSVVLGCLAASTPNLVHLALAETLPLAPAHEPIVSRYPAEAIRLFNRLETFTSFTRAVEYEYRSGKLSTSTPFVLSRERSVANIARETLEASSSLRWVSMSMERERPGYKNYLRLMDTEVGVAIRDASGELGVVDGLGSSDAIRKYLMF
ncbi:hypothetical protein MKEN_00939000 [Mycena kentingensis (nom. inval.)]|nr:hypothetical protein MKEN_00939000 [Mycena kentingensis (nom. inval.)]